MQQPTFLFPGFGSNQQVGVFAAGSRSFQTTACGISRISPLLPWKMVSAGIADETTSCICLIVTEQQHTPLEQAHVSDRMSLQQANPDVGCAGAGVVVYKTIIKQLQACPSNACSSYSRGRVHRLLWLETNTDAWIFVFKSSRRAAFCTCGCSTFLGMMSPMMACMQCDARADFGVVLHAARSIQLHRRHC